MSAECGVRIVRSADCRLRGRTISAERGPRSTADYGVLLFIRQAVIFRQATVGVAQVSDPADTECSGAQRRSAECGTQQTFYEQELQQVGGLESAHAYSRTFRRYPDPTMHLPEYGQPLP